MDPISDMFIRIKNAQKAGHETVPVPYSKFKYEIAKALERSGFLKKVERKGKKVRKILELALTYEEGAPKVNGIKFFSTPSRRLYTSYKDLRPASYGGIIVLTTPKGIMTSREARKEKVGGQLLAEIW